jgi:glucose/mannose-6-phosphate isomerase
MADASRGIGELRKRHDGKGMFDLVRSFPAHMADAWERGERFASSIDAATPRRVVVCGMGGSAIGGDLVRSFLGDSLSVPLHVNRLYEIPAALRGDAFFVFSSYSGNTGETLSAYDSIRGTGIPSAAVTTGGELEKRCREDGVPLCKIPGGMPPRAAIAYSFFPLYRLLGALGLTEVDERGFEEAAGALRDRCDEYASETESNEAFELALRLAGKVPFVYSCGGILDAVARRWCCQFNENSKSLAHFASFTELDHNEIVGWKAVDAVRKRILVLSLEDADDHPAARRQAEIALGIIGPLCGGVARVGGFSGGRLARILSAMILGDFTSVYLAYLNGVDPTPISNIDFLKERLQKSPD